MKIEKKLIAYGAIALLVGVASIAPLIFLMTGTARAQTALNEPWFNINVPYAYWAGNYTENPNASYTAAFAKSSEMVVNATPTSNAAVDKVDARFEYYQIEIYSDKGPIENRTIAFEFNGTENFNPSSFHFERDNWFDTNTTSFYPSEVVIYNTTTPQQLSNWGGSITAFIGTSNDSVTEQSLQVISGIKNSEATDSIFIDIRRLGWVTFEGNSTVATLSSNEILQHIELNKFGVGFLYNALIPQNLVSQTNLLNPLRTYYQQTP